MSIPRMLALLVTLGVGGAAAGDGPPAIPTRVEIPAMGPAPIALRFAFPIAGAVGDGEATDIGVPWSVESAMLMDVSPLAF